MGDCINIFLNAGKDALLPCDRSMCSIVEEQMATCYSPCMTARCDWSKSACSDQKELLGTCPFLDALVLESLEEHATGVSFVEGGSVKGYGRCSKYSCDESTVSTVPYGDEAVVTWFTAQAACESKGSTLIMTNLSRITGDFAWVGAKAQKAGSGNFTWLDGRNLSRSDPGWLKVGFCGGDCQQVAEPNGADPDFYHGGSWELCVAYLAHPVVGIGLWDEACVFEVRKEMFQSISIFCEDGQVLDPQTERVGMLPGKKCVVINDGGELIDSSDGLAKPAWGHCSAKRRLPSSGFHYDLTALQKLSKLDLATLLTRHPGCGTRPLEVTENVARSSGGGIYISGCDKSAERSGRCTLLDTRADRLSAMQVVFNENHAGLAGGGIFINCPEISTTCNAVIDAQLHLPKIQGQIIVAAGNTAHGYGNNIAQAPSRLMTSQLVSEYVPGRMVDVLRFAVALLDEREGYVKGSDTNVNPYQISLEVCPGGSVSTATAGGSVSTAYAQGQEGLGIARSCNLKEQLQSKQVFSLDALKVTQP